MTVSGKRILILILSFVMKGEVLIGMKWVQKKANIAVLN